MRVLIAGAGAVGCILGGALLQNGHDVVFLARRKNLDALKTRGLRVDFPDASWKWVRVQAIGPDNGADSFDAILFCVKGYDWQNAAAEIARFSAPSLFTFQNGVIVHHEIARTFPGRVLGSVIYVAADRLEPGV